MVESQVINGFSVVHHRYLLYFLKTLFTISERNLGSLCHELHVRGSGDRTSRLPT
jgi:hypothetical protein